MAVRKLTANYDIVVVGGGLAGVLCLKELTERGVDCVLLEAKSIGSGITKNTTAKSSCYMTIMSYIIFFS